MDESVHAAGDELNLVIKLEVQIRDQLSPTANVLFLIVPDLTWHFCTNLLRYPFENAFESIS